MVFVSLGNLNRLCAGDFDFLKATSLTNRSSAAASQTFLTVFEHLSIEVKVEVEGRDTR